MRRFISIFLSAVLLVVSSAPLVSAVACDMPPAHAAAMQVEDIHAALSIPHMHGENHHTTALSMDLDTCRLECGCGCQRSIDSLPNLLAPHVLSTLANDFSTGATSLVIKIEPILYGLAPGVDLPPPDLS